MELKSLNAKKSAIEKAFESVNLEKKTHVDKVAELDIELVKLQGEYRLIEELMTYKPTKKEQ